MLYNDKSFAATSRPFTRLTLLFSGRYLLRLGLVLTGIVSLVWLTSKSFEQSLFPIHYVKTIAAHHHTKLLIQEMVKQDNTSGARGINKLGLKAHLMHLSWIEQVTMWSVFPWMLIVSVTEREPIAIYQPSFNDTSTITQCVDRKGIIFEASPFMTVNHMPTLIGTKEQLNQLLQIYRGLSTLLHPQSLMINTVALDSQQQCTITLANNLQLLFGHFNPYVQLQKLLEKQAGILRQTETIAKLDLRYPSGVAITLRESHL